MDRNIYDMDEWEDHSGRSQPHPNTAHSNTHLGEDNLVIREPAASSPQEQITPISLMRNEEDQAPDTIPEILEEAGGNSGSDLGSLIPEHLMDNRTSSSLQKVSLQVGIDGFSQPDDGCLEVLNDHENAALETLMAQFRSNDPSNPDACLIKLPGEILDTILGFLFVNKDLGRSTSIAANVDFGKNAAYELHPAVLRVSRHLYERSVGVLYGLNVFYVACMPDRWNMSTGQPNPSSPITRWWSPDIKHPTAAESSALQKVRQWLVVVHPANMGNPPHIPQSITTFCQAICQNPPVNMDIALVPKGVQVGLNDHDYTPIEEVLTPLRLISGVKTFKLRDTTPHEIPDTIDQDDDAPFYPSHLEDYPVLEVELTLSCISTDLVEFAFDMHCRLLNYAKAFEAHEPFKLEMALAKGERIVDELIGSNAWFHHNNALRNPYRDLSDIHPVEDHLQKAKPASDHQDVDLFKLHRAGVINYLEPQYQRLSASATALTDFIRGQQCSGGVFDVDCMGHDFLSGNEEKCADGLALLQQFKAAFLRHAPDEIKQHIADHQAIFDSFYDSKVTWYIERLGTFLQVGNYVGFVQLFCDSFDELYRMFCSIREARKELFLADTLDQTGCTLDLELDRDDSSIDWFDEGAPGCTGYGHRNNPSDGGSNNGSDVDDNERSLDEEEEVEEGEDQESEYQEGEDQGSDDQEAIDKEVEDQFSEEEDEDAGDNELDEEATDGASNSGQLHDPSTISETDSELYLGVKPATDAASSTLEGDTDDVVEQG
ncbi:uncharacterized protein LY89DRAFT_760855 [Mollisia scopiformis]|uniref:Uncharacterized protein n=1 Tax=Mollisia scopiformis TaxID=149040 RepID=A0A132BDX2_MOLSC|nr:uncharacterized protein LY89DRAFT_760855 [Mollisia scopiformis]KUJ10034.1 hypothetical protein LY89DRAFT_760855 [Mollisia scopiformis]